MKWALPDVDTYFAPVMKADGFEIDHLIEALKFCKSFRIAVDGGAHVGSWSVYMAFRFKRVLSFEPAEDSYNCLVKNTEFYGNIAKHRAALGERTGNCVMVDDPTRLGNTGSRVAFYGKGTIPVVAVDDLRLTGVDFLKLDLEGSEIFALKGAAKTIERCKPTIMVECKEFSPTRNGGVAATRSFLQSLGYKEVGGIRNDRVFVPS